MNVKITDFSAKKNPEVSVSLNSITNFDSVFSLFKTDLTKYSLDFETDKFTGELHSDGIYTIRVGMWCDQMLDGKALFQDLA